MNVGWLILSHPAQSPDHLPSDYHLLGPLKNASENIMTPVMGHCSMLCACGCRRGSATFFRLEHVLLFEGGEENVNKDGDYLEN